MQEDKASKWFASELRKRQEEGHLPYDLGAWEAFDKKRTALARKKTAYWVSGIAATLTLLLVAGSLWISQESAESGDSQLSGQLALEEIPTESPAQASKPAVSESEGSGSSESSALALEKKENNGSRPSAPMAKSDNQAVSNTLRQPIPKSGSGLLEPKKTETLAWTEIPAKAEKTEKTAGMETSIANSREAVEEEVAPPVQLKEEVAPPAKLTEEAPVALLAEEPQLSDEEIKEILETKSFARIAMGLSPGFGSSGGSDQATSGSSLGLGVMVDMEITGKLVMGSGLAVNYLNQSSESQNYSYGGANALAASVTQTNEISQVQVDIPLYFKYPITRNQAISVQAGFSNLITFNQGAEQQSSYTRQVAVLNSDAFSSDFFTLKSESVNQSQDLSVPNQKFYPLATANLGVNIRLYESKKTSYEVMPFYNYPLQEFSGYGEKLGMFGASFKVNFGAIQKK